MSKKKPMDFLISFLLIYILLALTLYFTQRNFIYFPDTERPDPASFEIVTEIAEVVTEDDLALQGWYFPPKDGKPVIIYFHGNASHYGNRYSKILPYIEQGYGALLTGYRGYGGNPGSPSEQGFYKDARAYFKFLESKNIPLSKTVIYGESIGSGAATQMATEYKAAGLILEAPFSAVADVARKAYFFLPLNLLLKDQFRNIDKISHVKMPLLIIHGNNDSTIPVALSRRLFEAAQEPKQFVLIEGAGHNDLYSHGASAAVLEFLTKTAPFSGSQAH
jgi:fermentation-respiration switch protein FrsA (DUF1100 family)